jgi:hypothetical protein
VETLYRYPRGAIGVARLLVRIAFCILLCTNELSDIFTGNPSAISLVLVVICIGLCLGLFTSVLAAIAAALSIWALFAGHLNHLLVQVAAVLLSVVIAILGPGAFSVDGLLFGRRRVIR